MLKIGSDYTPQISDFIVAEILSYCSETSVYILKILRMWFLLIYIYIYIKKEIIIIFFWLFIIKYLFIGGLSEVQVPIGKFTIMEDTVEQTTNDTITLNYAQIMEPRSIFINNTDKETILNTDKTITPDTDKTIITDTDKTITPDINKAINCV